MARAPRGHTALRFLLILLLSVPTLYAQAPAPIKTTAASANEHAAWSVTIAPAPGEALLIGCDFSDAPGLIVFSDSVNDLSIPLSSGPIQQTFFVPSTAGGSVTVTCTAPSTVSYNEIYVTEFPAGTSIDNAIVTSGAASPAKGSIVTSSPNETVWAYTVTGSASNAIGWIALSRFDNNLVASEAFATAGPVSATFKTTGDWSLTLVALKSGTPLHTFDTINVSANLLWYDATGTPINPPIAGTVQVYQLTAPATFKDIGDFPIDANGNAAGSIAVDVSLSDPLVFNFVLVDSTGAFYRDANGNNIAMQQGVPKLFFSGIGSVASGITVNKANGSLKSVTFAAAP